MSIYTSECLGEIFTIHAGVEPVSLFREWAGPGETLGGDLRLSRLLLRFHFEVMVAARRYGGKNNAVRNVAHSAAEGLECHGMRYMFA
jgi:hypothetical protein